MSACWCFLQIQYCDCAGAAASYHSTLSGSQLSERNAICRRHWWNTLCTCPVLHVQLSKFAMRCHCEQRQSRRSGDTSARHQWKSTMETWCDSVLQCRLTEDATGSRRHSKRAVPFLTWHFFYNMQHAIFLHGWSRWIPHLVHCRLPSCSSGTKQNCVSSSVWRNFHSTTTVPALLRQQCTLQLTAMPRSWNFC